MIGQAHSVPYDGRTHSRPSTSISTINQRIDIHASQHLRCSIICWGPLFHAPLRSRTARLLRTRPTGGPAALAVLLACSRWWRMICAPRFLFFLFLLPCCSRAAVVSVWPKAARADRPRASLRAVCHLEYSQTGRQYGLCIRPPAHKRLPNCSATGSGGCLKWMWLKAPRLSRPWMALDNLILHPPRGVNVGPTSRS